MRRDANVKGEESDGTLQRACFNMKQGGTAGRRLSLNKDGVFFVSAAVLAGSEAASHSVATTLQRL